MASSRDVWRKPEPHTPVAASTLISVPFVFVMLCLLCCPLIALYRVSLCIIAWRWQPVAPHNNWRSTESRFLSGGTTLVDFKTLFPVRKPLIACIHLLPLPGSPGYAGRMRAVYD